MKSRGGQIRTDDFLLPKQALYQAELRPVQRADRWGIRDINQAILPAICNRSCCTVPDRLTAGASNPMLSVTTGVLYDRRAEIFRRVEKTLRT